MIRFLCKGLLRDPGRSLFPVGLVAVGVALTVVLHAWMQGALDNLSTTTAHFQTGHLKVTTRAYAELGDQAANDLALLDAGALQQQLQERFPGLIWTERIRFGGLLDVPDEAGETRAQGPAFGLGVDLLGADSPEPRLLQLARGLVEGRLPSRPGEALIGERLAQRLGVGPGDTATLLSTTFHGGMAMHNFAVAGVVRFGVMGMDRGAVIADLGDVRRALDMEDAAGELLGFFRDDQYDVDRAAAAAAAFNAGVAADDEFAPLMRTLRDQNGLGDMLDLAGRMLGIMVAVFLLVMFVVLWNAGLMGSLRRYGEIGVRLAIGEDRGHLFRSMLWEALLLGLVGSALGTALGLGLAWWLQVEGIDIGARFQSSSMMIAAVFRARITPATWVIGFLPGIAATVLGTAAAGVGIYRRQTANLFKELET